MAFLHDVVCLSSPFYYIDLNTDEMFQSNIYIHVHLKQKHYFIDHQFFL